MNKFIRADFKTYKPKYKLYCNLNKLTWNLKKN